jgi:hypothetical protein
LALLAAPWLSQPGDDVAAGPVTAEPLPDHAVASPNAEPPPLPQAVDILSWAVLPPER